MEAKYKSLSIFEFQERFPDEDSCLQHLAVLKWRDGYACARCKHKNSCKAVKKYDRQCSRCNYVESPTAGTLFHKVKFPILKAMWIVYYVSTNKKGISSLELSRKLELRANTCLLFKRKVMQAMVSSNNFPMVGDVELDEFVVGQQEEGVVGRKNGSKKLVIIGIEKGKKGVKRMYAKVIDKATKKNIKEFIDEKISDEATIKTDGWSAYRSLAKEMPNLTTENSTKKGKNFGVMHRVIMNFKAWLRCTHGHVEHLQSYLHEYAYRYNRHRMKEGIFDNLLEKMVSHSPVPYKLLIN